MNKPSKTRNSLALALGLVTGLALAAEQQAEDIIGMEIHNSRGEKLGAVEDLAVDWQDGRVAYAIVSYGGIFQGAMDVEDKLFAVPARALTMTDEALVLDIEVDQIQEAWGFDRYDWPDLEGDEYAAQVHDWYQLRQDWEQQGPSENVPTETEVEQAGVEYLQRQATGTMQKATDLDDMQIVDVNGEEIGEVDELIVDWEQGQVVRVPVEFGGFLGLGETEVDVPISAMTLKAKEASTPLRFSKDNYLQLEISRDDLEAGNIPQPQ
ncbi:MAG: PRC-barrel domain-containing protein [Candidatus Competibacteraceae bacterium]|nr:PRC-barrel domain-containing protein [Candidatus Competibacteraceae bacterium]